MFNMKDIADMGKLAGQAKELQKRQEESQAEQIDLLKHIASTLDKLLVEVKNKK